MKCQIQFSGKNKKNINLSSAYFAQRAVKVTSLDSLGKCLVKNYCKFMTAIQCMWAYVIGNISRQQNFHVLLFLLFPENRLDILFKLPPI